MKSLKISFIVLFFSTHAFAHNTVNYKEWIEDAKNRCQITPDQFPDLDTNRYSFNMNSEQLRALAFWTYDSERRLPEFAHYNKASKSFTAKLHYGDNLTLNSYFLYSIKGQIESALKRKLADYISVIDMGIARFYVPNQTWETIQNDYPSFAQSRTDIYERIINDRSTKVFYPTAMYYDLSSSNKDAHLMWRYVNRNLFITNYGVDIDVIYDLDDKFNTVRLIDGYKMISAAFTISANKNGCFSYMKNGKKKFFDLSFYTLGHTFPENYIRPY